MKRDKKKSGRDEPGEESPDSDIVGHDNRDNPHGIDAIRALQMIAGGIAALELVLFVLRDVLHLI